MDAALSGVAKEVESVGTGLSSAPEWWPSIAWRQVREGEAPAEPCSVARQEPRPPLPNYYAARSLGNHVAAGASKRRALRCLSSSARMKLQPRIRLPSG